MNEDLRRISRVNVCCRVVVRDRYGVWTGVTEDLSAHGCQIVTTRLPRPGTLITLTLSSDLFPEELEAIGEAAWSTPERIGVRFIGTLPRPGALSADEWLRKVVEHGAIPNSPSTWRVAPSVSRPAPGLSVAGRSGRVAHALPTASRGDDVIVLPVRR